MVHGGLWVLMKDLKKYRAARILERDMDAQLGVLYVFV